MPLSRTLWVGVACGLAVAGLAPAAASASLLLARTTSAETLRVDARGRALVTWREGATKRRAVIASDRAVYQGGSIGKAAGIAVTPTIPLAVVQIALPNGTQVALQKLQRLGNHGSLGPVELRYSRWRGEATRLSLTGEWTADGRRMRICGTATYHGTPFYGLKHTIKGNPLDAYGRNVYIDTLRSSGWYRIFGVLTRPRGFALMVSKPEWIGTAYRAVVPGPNLAGDLAPDATAETVAPTRGTKGQCPFPPGTYGAGS
jgi:hypothetical protein